MIQANVAEDILSQEEVDALLRGVGGEAEEPAAAADSKGVRPYDIGRQERIVRGRMPTLELVNERFARLMGIGLYHFMRKNAEITVGPVRVLKFSEFVRNLVVPANLNLVQVKPLRGMALMVFEPALVFQIVDGLFGGDGRLQTRTEGRDFTATEMRIIQRLLQVVFEEYQKAWHPVYELEFAYQRSEVNTQFVNIAAPNEVVVTTTFSIDLGAGTADFHVCMPYAMLEPIRDVIYSAVQADRAESDQRWLTLLTQQVYDAQVELVANLAHAEVNIGQLMALQPGDVIALDLPDLVRAEIDSAPVLECRYGVMNGHYALKVEKIIGGHAGGGGDGG
jgi:flagellar motor switch protein FliM